MFNIIGRSVFAASFTVVIFLLMSYLITPGAVPPEPPEDETQISILRKQREEISLPANTEIPAPPKMENSPPPLMAMAAPAANLDRAGFSALTPGNGGSENIGLNIINNQRAIPIVYFAPEYPQRAITQGIEGWVMLEFTIAADGSVTDIEVVDAEPEGLFERAAMRTIARWSYQPKMLEGRPVAQTHMRELFRFEIKN